MLRTTRIVSYFQNVPRTTFLNRFIRDGVLARCLVPRCDGMKERTIFNKGGTMGQILHGSAKTTHVVRATMQRSKTSIQALSERYGLNTKTVMKWKQRDFVQPRRSDPARTERRMGCATVQIHDAGNHRPFER